MNPDYVLDSGWSWNYFLGIEDYPRTFEDFTSRFATEASCREYLAQLRWPDGFRCPSCHGDRAWEISRRGLMECAACGHQASVTAGTIFQDTHKPLRVWFHAIWLVTTTKQGASAMAIQQVLGLGSYRTAWAWLHKLRHAMVRPDRERLEGSVEVDEAWVGESNRACSAVRRLRGPS